MRYVGTPDPVLRRSDLTKSESGRLGFVALLVASSVVLAVGVVHEWYQSLPARYYHSTEQCAYVMVIEGGKQVEKGCEYANEHWTRRGRLVSRERPRKL